MSQVNVAINGFGRIGRNAFKIAFERSDVKVVAINDLTDTQTLAHLLKHDTVYGTYQNEVGFDETSIIVNGQHIFVFSEEDPSKLPWTQYDVDVVIESTGRFSNPAKARTHIDQSGAKRVVISAPAKGDGSDTIIMGVNEDNIGMEGISDVLSCASCTTNCSAPVMAVIDASFGVEKAMMTTIHSYTSDQKLQDSPHHDLRRARAAAENIVPTITGAADTTSLVVPSIADKFGAMSLRVPTPVVSLADFVVLTKREVTVQQVNDVFKKAAEQPYYQGILEITEEKLVSCDFRGDSHSAVVDLSLTNVVGGNLVKVVAWYDNEWGYSNRIVELVADVGRAIRK